jgi:prepilin-type N-terminal cleavage/methylation domain-containing protein
MSASTIYTQISSDQRGFTLIETLVSMVAGVVVTGALSMVFIVALHQTSRLTDSVQASQLGRTAMTHVVDELRSACIARNYTPVQEGSTSSQLIFRDAYGEEALIVNAQEAPLHSGAGAFEHQIVFNSSAHTLTDYVYPSEKGSEWPTYKFPGADYESSKNEAAKAEPKQGIQLANNVTSASFKYFQYGESATESSTTPLTTLEEIKLTEGKLPKEDAPNVAAVAVTLTTAPLDGNTKLSRAAEFSNEVTFAFGTPSSEAKIEDKPCD